MSTSRVSVIVPAYNSARYLREAIDSIASQVPAPHEIIVVDNASTDETPDLIASDTRVRHLHCGTRGVSAARNHGLGAATGDYVAFLDADDRWRPGMLAAQTAFLDACPEIDATFTNFVRFDDTTNQEIGDQFRCYPEIAGLPQRAGPVANSAVIEMDGFEALIGMGEIPAFTQVMMFRRGAIGDVRFDASLRVCEDLHFVMRVLPGRRIGFISTVLAEVRRHDSNATADVSAMADHKLTALLKMKPFVPPTASARYQERLTKAHLDSAVAACRAGDWLLAIRRTTGAWRCGGSLLRKARGTARVLLTACAPRRQAQR